MQVSLKEPGISTSPTHQPLAELAPSEGTGASGGGPNLSLLSAGDHPPTPVQAIELPDSVHFTAEALWSLPFLSVAPIPLQVDLSGLPGPCPVHSAAVPWLPQEFPSKVKLALAACAEPFRSLHSFWIKSDMLPPHQPRSARAFSNLVPGYVSRPSPEPLLHASSETGLRGSQK